MKKVPKTRATPRASAARASAARAKSSARPRLLSGGNPQIAKAYGDEPVQAYIAAMPGWKQDIGRRLDALISQTLPGVRKAIKYNSPLYGVGDPSNGWFLGIHCIAKYVKVAFFRGSQLRPLPPGESKMPHVRYLHIYPDGQFDHTQFTDWLKQASKLPGERL